MNPGHRRNGDWTRAPGSRRAVGQAKRLRRVLGRIKLVAVSKIEQIEAELRDLSPAELRQVRDWLIEMVATQQQFREDFEPAIWESEQEMAADLRPHAREF